KSVGSLEDLRGCNVTPYPQAAAVTPVTPTVTPLVRGGGPQRKWPDEIGRAVVRLVRAGYREIGQGATFEDVIRHIRPRLPESIRNSSSGTLYSGHRKALEALPAEYEWCVSRVRLWAGANGTKTLTVRTNFSMI